MLALLLTAALAWTPSPQEQQLVRALSSRDAPASCAELEALVPEPVQSLAQVVDQVSMPPWAPMRAATCLIENHSADRPALFDSWVTQPNKRGLAKLVFARLHLIEPVQRLSLVEHARLGPYTDALNSGLLRSPSAELRALAR